MVTTRNLVFFALLLQITLAHVEFLRSKLYDETDFEVQEITIPTFFGGRIYASVPVSSANIAKNLIVHDYIHNEISLYEISKLTNDNEKGYFKVQADLQQVKILNKNPGNATAPIAVWVVQGNADGIMDTNVYEAANLIVPPSLFELVTVMSAEPFTLQTKTSGPQTLYAILAGFDEMISGRGDDDKCTPAIDKMDATGLSDIQIHVHSPLFSIAFDGHDYENSRTSINADVGNGKPLDFSGISFAASPGFTGCRLQGQRIFRSSLYDSTTSFTYSNSKSFDVALTSFVNTDNEHPVTVNDNTNKKEYKWSGTTPENTNSQNITLQQTNNIDISWTRNENDLDESFLIRLIP